MLGKIVDWCAMRAGLHVHITKAKSARTLTLDENEDIITALYRLPFNTVVRDPIIAPIPIDRCRNFFGFGYHESLWHPFTKTLAVYRDQGRDAAFEFLLSYYGSFQPCTAADALGIEDFENALDRFPAGSWVLPWTSKSPNEAESRRRLTTAKESIRYGGLNTTASDGLKHFGPVSERFAEIELNRLIGTYESIKKWGYDRNRSEDDIVVQAMHNGGREAFLVCGGQHRVASLAALKHESVCARLLVTPFPVIHLSDVDQWPHVRDGLYTKKAATEYVTRSFFSESHDNRAAKLGLWK